MPPLRVGHADFALMEEIWSLEPELELSVTPRVNTLSNLYTFPVFTPGESAWLIREAERQAAVTGWSEKRHKNFPTCDQPLRALEAAASIVTAKLRARLLPRIQAYYGFPTVRVC